MSEETKTISAQDIMDKLTSLAETMVNLQTQIDGIKVNEKQVESDSEKEQEVSSEEAWESLFKWKEWYYKMNYNPRMGFNEQDYHLLKTHQSSGGSGIKQELLKNISGIEFDNQHYINIERENKNILLLLFAVYNRSVIL